jgi:hypothetical protein
MCKFTCILVFSLNHATKSSIRLLPFGSHTLGELLSWHQERCSQAPKTTSQKDVDIARKGRFETIGQHHGLPTTNRLLIAAEFMEVSGAKVQFQLDTGAKLPELFPRILVTPAGNACFQPPAVENEGTIISFFVAHQGPQEIGFGLHPLRNRFRLGKWLKSAWYAC